MRESVDKGILKFLVLVISRWSWNCGSGEDYRWSILEEERVLFSFEYKLEMFIKFLNGVFKKIV